MLGAGGMVEGGIMGPGGNLVSSREVSDLQEKLRISESLFQEMTMSWEQKVQETEKIHQVGIFLSISLPCLPFAVYLPYSRIFSWV